MKTYRLFNSILVVSLFLASSLLCKSQEKKTEWSVLKHYDQEHLARIAMPIGGIGTGTVSLGGRGDLRDWEIMNRPAKGFMAGPGGNRCPFFAIYLKQEGNESITRSLMGPLEYSDYEGKTGSAASNHGLPRFSHCSFDAAYPFGKVNLSDPDLPVEVKLIAYNPLIPGDAENSGIPIAILKYVVYNNSEKTISVAICGTMDNFIGNDGSQVRTAWTGDFEPIGADDNKNTYREGKYVKGIYMYSDGVKPEAEQWGTIALTTDIENSVSYRTEPYNRAWGNDLLDLWDDFSKDGILEERENPEDDSPTASLAVNFDIPPNSDQEISFYLTWHFPNRFSWASERIGNYYTTKYKDAWEVAEFTTPVISHLENKTIEFVNSFCESDIPDFVKEAALFNASTLRTQTCFRTEDGRFYGWEGCHDTRGCCHGSCTHVWNYEQTTAFLFGDLAKIMREIEFGQATNEDGLMSFRVSLPIENAQASSMAAADGQMGCIMKVYRDWQLSGDEKMLRTLWPGIKAALEFCWIEGGWDADKDGVMEGCQHNTMDVEYYGPNPQMGIWYLGALKASEEMAEYIGDKSFAKTCKNLFDNGSIWIDENLFNGEYYEQEIRPPKDIMAIAPSLTIGMGSKNIEDPEYQLGQGCLVDQLVGQYFAHICNLGYLIKPENAGSTLTSIMKYNYKESLFNHFNCMRSFALGDESALLMASFPKSRPKIPFPYFSEVMTGFEYTAAIGMLYENQVDNGLLCIKNIRDRYDGKRRNPFDEAECGHHYARAMASWAAMLALTGFHYSSVEGTMEFASVNEPTKWFWSNGYAWGTFAQNPGSTETEVVIEVLNGKVDIKNVVLKNYGSINSEISLSEGESIDLQIPKEIN